MWSLSGAQYVAQYARDFVQIMVLAWLLYRVYIAIAQTKATQMLMFVIYYAVAFIISFVLQLSFFLRLFRLLTIPLLLFLCVLYHPELRRAFSGMFLNRSRFFRMGGQTTGEQLDSILNACTMLVTAKRGALIVFPRHIDIKQIIDSGTKLNADLSTSLILTVFDHDTPLHDGALIVQAGRIVAASCYLPLSDQTGIKATFGTRHRAALGLAEQSDAVILVVSEETGAISLAYNANIYYNLEPEVIKKVLLALFSYHDVTPQDIKEAPVENE